MSAGFFELTIIVSVAAVLSITAKLLKQPLILAYIATGALIGYFDFFNLADQETFQIFSHMGIMFLLFLIGLEINYTSLRMVGKTSVLVGLGQIAFTFIFGYIISGFLGFSTIHAAYIAIALTFSSTIIIIKLLSDKKSINSLYGKISIGFLLVQDLVVILMLILLAGISAGKGIVLGQMVLTFILGIVLFGLMLVLGRTVFPFIFDKLAKSQELLFLTSLAWVFFLAGIIHLLKEYTGIGFSLEVAGFLAGLALANSSEHFQIANKIKPLRDFFILIFFAILGSSLVFYNFQGLIIPIIVLSLFVLIGNPLIVLIIMGLMGYRKRTSFLAGVTVAQISEFSLILAEMGRRVGHIDNETLGVIAAVGVITITASTYLIIYGEEIFKYLSPFLSIFEKKKTREQEFDDGEIKKPIILIGYDRTGKSIAYNLPKDKILVIDFNPDVINELKKNNIACIFGDIMDPLIFETINFEEANLIISTSPVLEDNLSLLEGIKILDKKPKIIIRAETEKELEILYEKGADYVLYPYFSSGHYLGKIINENGSLNNLSDLRQKDISFLQKL